MPKKSKNDSIVITQKENEDPISTEILAQSIKEIAEGFKRIERSSLNRRALLVLLKDASGESMNTIEKVLNALDNLEKLYTKK